MPTKIIPFKTAYSDHERHYIPTGDGMEDIYEYQVNKYGQKELIKVGEKNIYEMIQESFEETKIENILARVAMGDNSVLRPDGIYTDLTEMPSNLIEARQAMQKLENLWDSLGKDIKEKYNFSVENFIAQSGSDEWLKDMGLLKTEEVAKPQTNNNNTETKGEES